MRIFKKMISKLVFVSIRNVKIDVSLLDPFGPFFVPPGRTIETGSILKLPVTYQPEENHEDEVSYLLIEFNPLFNNWEEKLKSIVGRDSNKICPWRLAFEKKCPSVSFYSSRIFDFVPSWARNFPRWTRPHKFNVYIERIILRVFWFPWWFWVVMTRSWFLWIFVT